MVRFFMYALIFGIISNVIGQNSRIYYDEFDGVTPCQTSWSPIGAMTGFTGHDLNNMFADLDSGALVLEVQTHPSQHGPLYYRLNQGDDLSCRPGEGLVDASNNSYFSIRAKATENMQIRAYLQEGHTASWDYKKISAIPITMNLTTEYQTFCTNNISTNSLSGDTLVDLTNIGNIVFDLGKSDSVNYDQVDGKVFIDYILIHYESCLIPDFTKENSSDQSMIYKVYPNPNNGEFNVENLNDEKLVVSLYSLNGMLVENKSTNQKETLSFKSDLSKGVYFLQVKSKLGIGVSKVLIK